MRLSRLLPIWLLSVACTTHGSGTDPSGPGGSGSGAGPQFPGGGTTSDDPFLTGAMDCYEDPADPGVPVATIEHVLEVFDGIESVRVRLTLDPKFVDNTYGDHAMGWENSKKGEHKFKDLVGSDHAQLQLFAVDGDLFELKLDYLSEDDSAPSGYANLGVTGGDGKMLSGIADHVLATSTSLDRNLNERGLDFLDSSPATDEAYTPNPSTPEWDYRVVYEVWIDHAAFPGGFDSASIEFIHASPSKTEDNTIIVDPGDCPPDWCNDPDGCDPGDSPPTDTPPCNDPDGCGPGDAPPPGGCVEDTDCPSHEFCGETGECLPRIG